MNFAADRSTPVGTDKPFMSRRVLAMDGEALSAEIGSLPKLGTDELRERWQAVYGKAPSREIGRSCLIRAIACLWFLTT